MVPQVITLVPWDEFVINTVNGTSTGKPINTSIFVSLCSILVCTLKALSTMVQLELQLPELVVEGLKCDQICKKRFSTHIQLI